MFCLYLALKAAIEHILLHPFELEMSYAAWNDQQARAIDQIGSPQQKHPFVAG